MKILFKFTLFSVVIMLLCIGVFLFVSSPGKTPLFLDSDGSLIENSIAEIRDIEINGVKQRVLIRGVNKSNPLLLHLHGGPGGPDQTILQSYGKTLEDLFTVVYWDQRGSGASYYAEHLNQPLSLTQLAQDGISLSKMLLVEFSQDQLYLQGHSWGTLLGIEIATQAPELYKAFFAIGLFADSKRAEKLSWEYALNSAKTAGDNKTVKELLEIGSPPYATEQTAIQSVTKQRKLMWPYEIPNGQPLYDMAEIYWLFARYPAYTINEKLNSLKGLDYSMTKLWPAVVDTNLIKTHKELELPFYVFQGKHDQHTVTEVSKSYFDILVAPEKRYYEFEKSAHWPHIREYELYRQRIVEIIQKLES